MNLVTAYLVAIAMFAVAMGLSYALAVAGEPQSHWIWCSVLGLC